MPYTGADCNPFVSQSELRFMVDSRMPPIATFFDMETIVLA